jgi:hypothetical protein
MVKHRLKSLKIKQVTLASRLGVAVTTINRRVAADSPELASWLDALEMLTPEQRATWLDQRE